MPGKFIRILLLLLALIAGSAVAACGTVATPEWAAEAQATRAAEAATSEHLTAIAPTATPTTPPTATLEPPTATPEPPTATPEPPTATPEPATATPEPPTAAPAGDASAPPADLAARVAAANAANGQAIFTTQHETANGTWACAQCHSVTPDEARIIGPGLWNVSVHGGMHVPGEDALHYIYQSIVNPSAYVVPDYPDNLMPKNWHEVLGEQGVEDVIAYLLTLHD